MLDFASPGIVQAIRNVGSKGCEDPGRARFFLTQREVDRWKKVRIDKKELDEVKVSGKKKEETKESTLRSTQARALKDLLRNQPMDTKRTEMTCDEHPRENHFLQGQGEGTEVIKRN